MIKERRDIVNEKPKFLSLERLQELVTWIKTKLSGKVDKEAGKSLVDDAEITKLETIEENAQANVIEGVSVNGVAQTVDKNKIAKISLPIKRGNASNSAAIGNIDLNVASSQYAIAEGTQTTASGEASHAEGERTTSSGSYSHAEGLQTVSSGSGSHTEGTKTQATNFNAHAEGNESVASGQASHAEGSRTTASGNFSHSQGRGTIAAGRSQDVSGEYNIEDASINGANYRATYAEIVGNGTSDSDRSNARTLDWDGNETLAGKLTVGADPTNDMDVVTKKYYEENIPDMEWDNILNKPDIYKGTGTSSVIASSSMNVASGPASFASGIMTTSSAFASFAEGMGTNATGPASHAENYYTEATAGNAHAEGTQTQAKGRSSHSQGTGTVATHRSQHVMGEFNVLDTSQNQYDAKGTYVEIVGNGSSVNARSNARTLDWDGNEVLAGKLTVGADPINDMDVATKGYIDTELANKQDALDFGTPTAEDVGKALMPKTIENGEVTEWEFGEAGMVDDVQINGTSIVNDKVANIPVATKSGSFGVVKAQGLGIVVDDGTYGTPGELRISPASSNQIKRGNAQTSPITATTQHQATFYGLTKAAGVDMASSSNPVGTYTPEAKTAIKSMLGVNEGIEVVRLA